MYFDVYQTIERRGSRVVEGDRLRTQEVFRALSDPTRREILKLLQGGSLTAGDIAARFPQTKGSLSHHFNILKAADLVRSDRRGQNLVYSLNTSVLEDVGRMVMDLLGSTPAVVVEPPTRRRKREA
jgi:ArsR family transcriptional regulator, arsenate/arsenite/antimonite-responsive transcriptional repressor